MALRRSVFHGRYFEKSQWQWTNKLPLLTFGMKEGAGVFLGFCLLEKVFGEKEHGHGSHEHGASGAPTSHDSAAHTAGGAATSHGAGKPKH